MTCIPVHRVRLTVETAALQAGCTTGNIAANGLTKVKFVVRVLKTEH